MDNAESSNPSDRPTRRHTIDVDIQSTAPRYDFILPSYSRDRRVSSITTTMRPETMMNDGLTNIHMTNSELNASTSDMATNRTSTYE
jgi:hypothetical protein